MPLLRELLGTVKSNVKGALFNEMGTQFGFPFEPLEKTRARKSNDEMGGLKDRVQDYLMSHMERMNASKLAGASPVVEGPMPQMLPRTSSVAPTGPPAPMGPPAGPQPQPVQPGRYSGYQPGLQQGRRVR